MNTDCALNDCAFSSGACAAADFYYNIIARNCDVGNDIFIGIDFDFVSDAVTAHEVKAGNRILCAVIVVNGIVAAECLNVAFLPLLIIVSSLFVPVTMVLLLFSMYIERISLLPFHILQKLYNKSPSVASKKNLPLV